MIVKEFEKNLHKKGYSRALIREIIEDVENTLFLENTIQRCNELIDNWDTLRDLEAYRCHEVGTLNFYPDIGLCMNIFVDLSKHLVSYIAKQWMIENCLDNHIDYFIDGKDEYKEQNNLYSNPKRLNATKFFKSKLEQLLIELKEQK